MTAPTLNETAREIATGALQLSAALSAAHAIQWSPSVRTRPRLDTTERAKGGHGDPTGETVLDDRRLDVRQAVQDSEATLQELIRTLTAQTADLHRAISAWEGIE